jgi:hypothetical protein
MNTRTRESIEKDKQRAREQGIAEKDKTGKSNVPANKQMAREPDTDPGRPNPRAPAADSAQGNNVAGEPPPRPTGRSPEGQVYPPDAPSTPGEPGGPARPDDSDPPLNIQREPNRPRATPEELHLNEPDNPIDEDKLSPTTKAEVEAGRKKQDQMRPKT